MTRHERVGHLNGSSPQVQSDGTYRLVLKQECTETNRELFEEESAEALRLARVLGATVWWIHNGVRVETCSGVDPWASYTELNAQAAN